MQDARVKLDPVLPW